MANPFELTGTLKVLEDLQTFPSGFSKREFVIEVLDGKYSQMVKFECVRDKIGQLDNLNVGDELKVTFDIRGNEYNGRYYVNLVAWKIEGGGGGGRSGHDSTSQEAPDDPPAGSFDDSFDSEPDPSDDDIPF